MTEYRNWEAVRDWIVQGIATRDLREGDRVPPEQHIAAICGVGRHSVRRATAALAVEGVLSIEQGRGTFVRIRPALLYRIGRHTRFRENLRRAGVAPGSEALGVDLIAADADIARALAVPEGAPVHRILRRGLADGIPISLTRSYHCADRFPDLGARRTLGDSVSEIYRSHGITDYHRRETELFARLPTRPEARLLDQRPEQPVMVVSKTDAAPDGLVLGFGEALWGAGRVRFLLEDQ
ncbi:GntR family transcriptional regulator [Salipiger aestuarii]|uniref:GntR family phosphonate transport system transcriptional regulator n=1 Tax=Salipiger aestuarii TaxID=568098 RepID=A0A327YIS9_9RHOB|nr:UTRA domain-containing protein [Salipiger aestuarii]EIE50382.1 phosphonates metabolism transcriptional regulator PhnF [Citreicella sp. 357]KAA8609343.1 GntR family transcriptional regulator [Salipiger aestuarii]KAA8615120.1 GntR family transcriptional regulator [Salipiger aestuarii]KAB2542955.1 GntR family transcriptional regulator [Salipiger aestuarii]RAK20884.1 GntR family phosphonate transport system transcriptional regulator [Salipiger aestuarii]